MTDSERFRDYVDRLYHSNGNLSALSAMETIDLLGMVEKHQEADGIVLKAEGREICPN